MIELLLGAAVLYLLARGNGTGSVLPGTNLSAAPPVTGFATTTLQANQVAQQTTQQDQQLIGVGTQGANTAASALAAAGDISSGFATAIPVVGAAIGAVANVLLAQHTARLKGAIAENQLIPATVQAFDADVAELVAAYNNRTVAVNNNGTCPACSTAVQQMDNALYQYMKSNATGPGRAWTENSAPGNPIANGGAPPCNKACTAECCVFYSDFNNALVTLNQIFTGIVPSTTFATKTGTVWTVKIPTVYKPPAQYGNYSRAGYSVTLNSPS